MPTDVLEMPTDELEDNNWSKQFVFFFSLSLSFLLLLCERRRRELYSIEATRNLLTSSKIGEPKFWFFSLSFNSQTLNIGFSWKQRLFWFFSLHRWVLLLWARSIFVLQIFCLTFFFFLHVWIVWFMIYILRLVAEKILETKRMLFFFCGFNLMNKKKEEGQNESNSIFCFFFFNYNFYNTDV